MDFVEALGHCCANPIDCVAVVKESCTLFCGSGRGHRSKAHVERIRSPRMLGLM